MATSYRHTRSHYWSHFRFALLCPYPHYVFVWDSSEWWPLYLLDRIEELIFNRKCEVFNYRHLLLFIAKQKMKQKSVNGFVLAQDPAWWRKRRLCDRSLILLFWISSFLQLLSSFAPKTPHFYSGMKNSETGNCWYERHDFISCLCFMQIGSPWANDACFWNSLPLVLIGCSGVLLSIKRRLTSTVTKFKNEERKIVYVRERDSHKAFLRDATRTFCSYKLHQTKTMQTSLGGTQKRGIR